MAARIVISEFMDAPAVEALRREFDVDYRPKLVDEILGGGGYYLRMKQLYHDREEVTAYLARRTGRSPRPRKGQ